MKPLNRLIEFLVGGLFIFSGLIKCNDPVGTQIKLKEYFEVFAADFASFFDVFIPYALPIAIFIVVLEVALGAALLAGFKKRLTLHALLALILFFTFLTFYTAYFNKVTDCGCFGDAIKLTPWQSFYKDVILLVMIFFLWAQGKRISNKASLLSFSITGVSTGAALYIALAAVAHLPFIDFRPYNVGNDIAVQMEPAEPCKTEYVVLRDGEEIRSTVWRDDFMKKVPEVKEITETRTRWDETAQDSLTETVTRMDTTMKSVKNYDSLYTVILNEAACTPAIQDYGLYSPDGEDYTQPSLEGNDLILIVHNLRKTERASFDEIKRFMDALAREPELERAIFTSEAPASFEAFRHEAQLNLPFYMGDEKMLKTIIRSNPGLILLTDGVVTGKWHYNDIPSPDVIRQMLR